MQSQTPNNIYLKFSITIDFGFIIHSRFQQSEIHLPILDLVAYFDGDEDDDESYYILNLQVSYN